MMMAGTWLWEFWSWEALIRSFIGLKEQGMFELGRRNIGFRLGRVHGHSDSARGAKATLHTTRCDIDIQSSIIHL